MNNIGIDDIQIGASDKSEKRSKLGPIIFLIFIILIAGGVVFANYYFKNQKEDISAKELFIMQASNTKINKMIDNPIYEKIYDGLQTKDYETENNINFTNTIKELDIEYLRNLDFSKFDIKLNGKRRASDLKSSSEVYLKYSGNDIFNFKVVSLEDEIAVYSDEIYEKYVSINYDDINKLFNTNLNTNALKNKNKIDLSKTDIQKYFSEYKDIVLNELTEEMFSIDENYAIKNGEEQIEVTAYNLEIDQKDLNYILLQLLEKLKKDDELINHIITGRDDSNVFNIESNTPIIKNIKIDGIETEEETESNSDEEINIDFKNILSGNKIDISYNNFILEINKLIEKVKIYEGNGLKCTIYSSSKDVEKIRVELPQNDTIEIEFPHYNSEKENGIKITYVKNEEKDGFSLNIEKTEDSANTRIIANYSFIEKGVINKRFNFEIDTEGAINSQNYSNDIVISYLTNEGELKCIIDNEIRFASVPEIEELNQDNCLFLSNLSSVEYSAVVQNLYNKFLTTYNEKREDLNFIDHNTYRERSNTIEVSIDEARSALYSTVSSLMGQAQLEGREFTIQDLQNLSIEGHDVLVNIGDESAIIVVDIYMFSINKEFYLTDIQ